MQAGIGKGAFWLFLANLLFFVTGYALYFVLGNFLLTPAQFGVFGVMISLIYLVSMIFTFGLEQAVSKFVSESSENAEFVKRQALKLSAICSPFLFLVIFLLAPLIAVALNDESLVPYIQIAAFVPLFQPTVSVFFGYLNGLKRFKEQALHSIFYRICRTVFPIALAFVGFSLFGALAGLSLALLAYIMIAPFLLGFGKRGAFPIKKLLLFSIPLTIFALIQNSLLAIDLILLKALAPAAHSSVLAGYYTASQTLSRIPFDLATAFTAILFPLMSETTFKKQHGKSLFYLRNAYRYSFMLVAPLAAMIFSTAPELITLFYGPNYIFGAMPLRILSMGFVFLTLFLVSSTVISASGRPHLAAIIGFAALVIDVSLLLFLVPLLGTKGAALASLFSMFVASVIAASYVFLHFPLFPFKSIARICIASILVIFVSMQFFVTGVLLLAKYAFLIALFASALLLLGELKKEDLRIAINAIF